MKSIIALVSGFAALASAYTVADLSVNPSGNPIITPGKGEVAVAGKNFDITWTKTTEGTVTIYLCKGPSSNCVNGAVPLADKVANEGKFSWAVSTDLEPSAVSGEGYGIQLVVDANPKIYQWSAQFGISNPSYSGSSSSSVASSSAASSSAVHSSTPSGYATSTPVSTVVTTPSSYPTSVLPTGGYNSTVIQPTKSLSVPSSLKTTTTGSGSATSTTGIVQATGAAGLVQVGFGALVGGVVAALAL